MKDNVRRVALGCDHSSVTQKKTLKSFLEIQGYRVEDVGCFTEDKVDYPDIALAVCRKVVSGACERGIVLDGAGIGSCMAANKVRGIRAALCYDRLTALNSRGHNNANVLTLGGPMHGIDELCSLARTWLETRFEGGRHIVRINKIMAIEREGSDG
jgi:ribose 5-phosphate isomerase B